MNDVRSHCVNGYFYPVLAGVSRRFSTENLNRIWLGVLVQRAGIEFVELLAARAAAEPPAALDGRQLDCSWTRLVRQGDTSAFGTDSRKRRWMSPVGCKI